MSKYGCPYDIVNLVQGGMPVKNQEACDDYIKNSNERSFVLLCRALAH